MTIANDDDACVDVVAALDCRYRPTPWSFALDHRDAIERHWAKQRQERPQLFDGRVLMLTHASIDRAIEGRPAFSATYTDVSFKAFLAWRDFGHPVRGFRNGFGMAALQSADGAFILGEMGAHTANAGRVYFPSGTPDLNDLRGSEVDLAGSIRRELAEETGLDPETLAFADDFTLIHDPVRVAVMQRIRAAETAEALVARIDAALAAQAQPELARMHIVRTAADITPAMPPFVVRYLRQALAGDQPG